MGLYARLYHMPHYLLTLFIFTVYQGHGVRLDSYRDRILLGPFDTLAECNRWGEAAFKGFHSTPQTDTLSRDLMGYQCDKVK